MMTPARLSIPTRLLTLTAIPMLALLLLAVGGCGPGGDNTLSIPTRIGGIVKIPAGSTPLAKPTLLSRLADWMVPKVSALTGMESAGGGVVVRLYAMDASGNQVGPVLNQAITDDGGNYVMTIPSWDLANPSQPWVVAVGSAANGTLMRRLVDDNIDVELGRDIDPASEAAVRMLIEEAANIPISEVRANEFELMNAQVAAAADAVSGQAIDEVSALALQAARESEGVQRTLLALTKTAGNTRPLARAGRDIPMVTGATLTREAGAEDQDGDAFTSFRWTVDVAPATSTIPTEASNQRAVTFSPDVDGIYRLKLIVTDSRGATSPPDFATIIATTPPAQLTTNTAVDGEGRLASGTTYLVYTSAVLHPTTNQSFTDVKLQQIQPPFVGSDAFAYFVTDGNNNYGIGRVSVAVGTFTNRPPVVTDEFLSTPINTQIVTPAVLTNDIDPDGDPLSVTGSLLSATGATVLDNGNGTFTYFPPPGFSGVDAFSYQVSDGRSGVAIGVVTITVGTPTGSAPSLADESIVTIPNQPVGTPTLLANDTDADNDPLSLVRIDLTTIQGGTVSNNGNGTLTYAPPAVPETLIRNPGATRDILMASTSETHPAVSSDGTMLVYTTDMDHFNIGTGGSDFDVVAAVIDFDPVTGVFNGQRLWVSDADPDPLRHLNVHDTQPDVQCASFFDCTVIWVTDDGLQPSQLRRARIRNPGTGFVVDVPTPVFADTTDQFSPRMSLDANWVVFVARDNAAGGNDLELFRFDLTDPLATPQKLTDNTVDDDQPAVDRFGDVVVFHRNSEIWLTHTDGSGEVLLSGTQLVAAHPSVTADGTLIAFTANTALGTDLFSVHSDGSNLTQITDDGTVSQPWIADNGSRILFRSARDGDHDFFLR